MREHTLAISHHKALRSPVLAHQILFLATKAIFTPCLFPCKWAEMGNGNEGVVCPCPLLFIPKCISVVAHLSF